MIEQQQFNFSVPRARTTDPPASHRAAEQMERSGAMRGQRKVCLEMISANPGKTSKELGAIGPLDRYQVARRTKELESMKLVTRIEMGSQDAKWYAVE